jgi:uncharacterized protein with ATP-grasp and redox domains
MNKLPASHFNLPSPIIVSEKDSFAYFTFTQRLPVIINRIIAENNFNDSHIESLKTISQDIINGSIRPIKEDQGVDIKDWDTYIEPYLNKAWLDTPFYFAEAYFYRRIIEAIWYFNLKIDPFELQKRTSLETVMEFVRTASQYQTIFDFPNVRRGEKWNVILHNLLYLNLWGNRADLSLNPSEAGTFRQEILENNCNSERILLNDVLLIIKKITHLQNTRIDFIVDNAGFELVSDLFVIDFLLTSQVAKMVYVHLKSHPTFVSDAMIKDVHFTLKSLAHDSDRNVRNIAIRLQSYLDEKRLHLVDHFFWTSPLFFWEMPESLAQELGQCDLVFVKGDANYRRLVGDYHWPKITSFDAIVGYFPTEFVVLRTLKSEVILGLSQEKIKDLDVLDPQWLVNGSWGLIQLGK